MTIVTTNGYKVLVDADDFERLDRYSWWAHARGRTPYVCRSTRVNGKNKTIAISREIMGAKPGEIVDHINRNRLDNRKANLRICTVHQNARNRGPANGRKYKGTRKDNNGLGWVAMMRDGKLFKYLGYFKTEIEAAKAYDKAAYAAYGEFAYLNFPVKGMRK